MHAMCKEVTCVVTYLFCSCRYTFCDTASYASYEHVHIFRFDLRYACLCRQNLLGFLIHLPVCLHVANAFRITAAQQTDCDVRERRTHPKCAAGR